MKFETEIMRKIMVECGDIAVLWRANVGKFYTADLRIVTTGLPKGFPDLFGFRLSDNKIIFLEIKTPMGKASHDQINFYNAMRKYGCICGFAKNTQQAKDIILEKNI